MKFTIVKKGIILVSIPLLFQLAFIGLVARMQHEHSQAADWDSHSKEVIRQGGTVLRALVDAETGTRGFIVTSNPSSTEPYDWAIKELPDAFKQLQFLVMDNPQQYSRVQRIHAAADEAMAWFSEIVSLVRQGAKDDAVAKEKTLEGKRRMDTVRQEIARFLDEEKHLDNLRHGRLEASSKHLNWLLIAGACFAILTSLIFALAFSRSISQRLAVLTENAHRLSQGHELNALVRGSDEITHLDRSFRDMAAELSRSDKALRDQTQILESILKSMGDGVIVADRDGKFLVFNPAAEHILGVGRTDAGPEQWTERYNCYQMDMVTPYPIHDLPLVRAIGGEAVDAAEMYVRQPAHFKGTWISVTGRPLKDVSGALVGGVVVFRDISERKRIEDEIRGLNEQLEQRVVERTAALAESNRELSQKNQENEMFVYSVSHDLRSPLVNLQGFSQELATVCGDMRDIFSTEELPSNVQERGLALVDKEMAESIRFIQTSVMRLSGIIDALLRLSRVGRIEYQWQQVDVQALIATVTTSMASTIDEKGAEITVAQLPTAWGDPTAVEQVFANLIGNALNYLDPTRPGTIEIGSSGDGTCGSDGEQAYHTYYVRDNGLGIPEAYRAKIFQAFQRLHPGAAKGEGIGLSLIRRIVERHGGRIWFESVAGEGTTFFVTFLARAAGQRPTAFKKTSEKERGYEDERTAVNCLAGGR